MALEVQFLSGNVNVVDYTPTVDVPAGRVVVVGATPLIAHTAIPANRLGAAAVSGGIYQGVSGGAITAGAKVWWDDTLNRVTTTSAGNQVLGFLLPNSSAAAAGTNVQFIHDPAA
jgi:predicted RecA/RadA family phage recombinase